MTTLERGAGHVPDPEHVVAARKPLRGLVGSGNRPARLSHRSHLDFIIDQGITASCVGCSLSTAMYLRGQLSTPIPRPSAKAIYDLARLADRSELFDIGCRASAAAIETGRHGFVPWNDWPLFTENEELLELRPDGKEWIDTPPDFSVFREASVAVDTKTYGIDRSEDDDVIISLLEQALNVGQIPIFAMNVPKDYDNVRGAGLYDHKEPPRSGEPGHMQAICGYDEEAFEVVSSWGASHGDHGIVRVSKAFMVRPNVYEYIVVTQVPATTPR